MTAALEGGKWSAACLGRTLPPAKTRYPFYRRLGGPQGRSGRAKNLVPTGIRSRTVQPVVSRYADWATGPTAWTICKKRKIINFLNICDKIWHRYQQSPQNFFCKLLDYLHVRWPDSSIINALQDSNNVAILLKHVINPEAKTVTSEVQLFLYMFYYFI